MTCADIQARVDRAFILQEPLARTEIATHLDGCEPCARRYDRLFRAQSLLRSAGESSHSQILAPPERDLLRGMVLDPAERRWRRWPAVASAAALAIAATVTFITLSGVDLGRPSSRSEIAPRGAQGQTQIPLAIRPLCVSTRSPRVQTLITVAGEQPRCTRTDSLGLTYRNETGRPWYLQVLLVTDRGRTIQLYPGADEEPARLAATVDEQALPVAFPLARAGAGRHRLVARFSMRPRTGPDSNRLESQDLSDSSVSHRPGLYVVRLPITIGEAR